jgi:peptide-methionine (S)-S-oxide reductase
MMIIKRIQLLNIGYQVISYKGKKYGVTRTDFNEGRSIKVFAEELGGTDFISFNFYMLKSGDQLKPCEMPVEKVLDFLTNYEIELDS